MLQWIAKWFQPQGNDFPCVKTISNGDIRLEVYEYTKKCGHPGYLVELFAYWSGKWSQCACIGSEDAQTVVDLFQEVMPYLAEKMGARQLPAVVLWGKKFFIDERLRELRNVEDPDERVELRTV